MLRFLNARCIKQGFESEEDYFGIDLTLTQRELDLKRESLGHFMTTDEFFALSDTERSYLRMQNHVMSAYSYILGARIRSLNEANKATTGVTAKVRYPTGL